MLKIYFDVTGKVIQDLNTILAWKKALLQGNRKHEPFFYRVLV